MDPRLTRWPSPVKLVHDCEGSWALYRDSWPNHDFEDFRRRKRPETADSCCMGPRDCIGSFASCIEYMTWVDADVLLELSTVLLGLKRTHVVGRLTWLVSVPTMALGLLEVCRCCTQERLLSHTVADSKRTSGGRECVRCSSALGYDSSLSSWASFVFELLLCMYLMKRVSPEVYTSVCLTQQ